MRGAPCVAAILLGLFACGDDPDSGPAPPCSDRTGGALITFEVVDEALTVWSTDDAFIEEALRVEGDSAAETRIPVFTDLEPGPLCDPDYSWHPAPAAMFWADVTVEVCDGRPSFVESDPDYWLEEVDQYCPWTARVVAVDDRR